MSQQEIPVRDIYCNLRESLSALKPAWFGYILLVLPSTVLGQLKMLCGLIARAPTRFSLLQTFARNFPKVLKVARKFGSQ